MNSKPLEAVPSASQCAAPASAPDEERGTTSKAAGTSFWEGWSRGRSLGAAAHRGKGKERAPGARVRPGRRGYDGVRRVWSYPPWGLLCGRSPVARVLIGGLSYVHMYLL